MLVSVLYNLGKTEEIKNFIKDKIDNQDMFGMVLWIYASLELEDGNAEKAKEYFDSGFKRAADKLIKSLENLGSLE